MKSLDALTISLDYIIFSFKRRGLPFVYLEKVTIKQLRKSSSLNVFDDGAVLLLFKFWTLEKVQNLKSSKKVLCRRSEETTISLLGQSIT
jgi:hypothetical protein